VSAGFRLSRVSHHDEILSTALERFALQGIASTSIQDIASHAGTSKANVLYHFGSKENLISEALSPSLKDLEALLVHAEATGLASAGAQTDFVSRFVSLFITHRLAIHTVVTHPYSAETIPGLASAHQLMGRMAELVASSSAGEYDRLRFGVAVSGATYALVSAGILGVQELDTEDLQALLTDVVTSMLHTRLEVQP